MPTSMIVLMPKRISKNGSSSMKIDLAHLPERLDERRLGRADLVEEEIGERVVELQRDAEQERADDEDQRSRGPSAASGRRGRARRAR
jgi:hypothetical protein